jgi:hypothetical protein
MPSRGRKIWEASALSADTHLDRLNWRVVPNEQRLATHKPLLVWHFLAPFRRALVSERQFKKGVMNFKVPGRYTCAELLFRSTSNKAFARKLPALPIVYHTVPIPQMHLRRFSLIQSAQSIRAWRSPGVRASCAVSLCHLSFVPGRTGRQHADRLNDETSMGRPSLP